MHSEGAQIRAWCYINDMARRAGSLEQPEAVGHAFNIGNPRSAVTIYDLATGRSLAGGTGTSASPVDWADVELRIPNVDKARGLLDSRQTVEVEDGLERTIAWYREKQPASV